VKGAFASGQAPSKEQVREIFKAYTSTLRAMWNEKKQDHKTKKELFERAVSEFIESGIYQKVNDLCNFHSAKIKSNL
jgi:hypothetical protein